MATGRSTGAGLVLTGRYYLVHDSLYVRGDIIETSTGTVLRSLPVCVSSRGDPLAAIEALTPARVMGAMSTWMDPRLRNWATAASQPASFEAYRIFSDGLTHVNANDSRGAIPFLEEASRLDTTYYMPILYLVSAYADAGRRQEVDSLVQFLDARRERLAPWDGALLDYHKANLRGNPAQQYDAIMRVVRLSPNSDWNLEAASAALGIDRPREALQALDRLDQTQERTEGPAGGVRVPLPSGLPPTRTVRARSGRDEEMRWS